MRVGVLAAVVGLLGFFLGRASAPQTSASAPPPSPPRAWTQEEQRLAVNLCLSDTINVLGYAGCNGEAFCRCAVARSAASGPSPDTWDAEHLAFAAHAYHRAVGHPCTEEAVKACGGWRD